jgi:hypothetical protein
MEYDKAIKLLNESQYKFAKTAKNKNPHWYTLKDTWNSEKDFKDVVQFIRDNGDVERFWKIEYKCFHYNGWKWWTMGADIDETILINKTYASERYNKIAYKYDTLFTSDSFKKENDEIIDMLKPYLYNVGILDVGCGTGLLLDMFTIDPTFYTGIDPSYGMIKQARLKHPIHKFKLDKLETYIGYDNTMVSLFGSMNYVLPDYLHKVDELSQRHFLMFYKNNYKPVTYDIANVEMYPFKYNKKELKSKFKNSKIKTWNNYYIVSNL